MTPEQAAGPAGRMETIFNSRAHDELLRSTVRLARLALGASATSVFLYDEQADCLVFEASSGAGEDTLTGVTIPARSGIAGWVWSTGEAITVHDLANDARFDRDFAEQTGYVPNEIMAAPLELDGEVIGVIEALDSEAPINGSIAAIDLLSEIAIQCAAAVSLLRSARQVARSLSTNVRSEQLLRLDAALRGSADGHDDQADALVTALATLLEQKTNSPTATLGGGR